MNTCALRWLSFHPTCFGVRCAFVTILFRSISHRKCSAPNFCKSHLQNERTCLWNVNRTRKMRCLKLNIEALSRAIPLHSNGIKAPCTFTRSSCEFAFCVQSREAKEQTKWIETKGKEKRVRIYKTSIYTHTQLPALLKPAFLHISRPTLVFLFRYFQFTLLSVFHLSKVVLRTKWEEKK